MEGWVRQAFLVKLHPPESEFPWFLTLLLTVVMSLLPAYSTHFQNLALATPEFPHIPDQ